MPLLLPTAELKQPRLIAILLMIYTTVLTVVLFSQGMQVPVYTQERRTDTFIYTTGQSALDEFSICFWMNCVNDDDDWQKDVLISFATPENDNEMLVAFDYNQWLQVNCRNECKKRYHPKLETEDVNDMLIGWNQHCFTVAKEETYTLYSKSADPGDVLRLVREEGACNLSARANWSMVLFQDQDKQLGDFDVDQTIEASVALVNMWDYKLPLHKLGRMTCLTKGNLKSMGDMSISGPTGFSVQEVPCVPVVKDDIRSLSGISFQGYPGARLENQSLLVTRASKFRCLQKCADLPECFSVNYHAADGICELNHYNYLLSDPSAAAGYAWYDCS